MKYVKLITDAAYRSTAEDVNQLRALVGKKSRLPKLSTSLPSSPFSTE